MVGGATVRSIAPGRPGTPQSSPSVKEEKMRPHTLRRVACTVAALALALAGPAPAATYIVDRFDDSTIQTCSILFNDCALRGAIIKANQHPGTDTVNLGTGTYTLTIAGVNEDLCQTGDLDVLDNLIIEGEGPERTFIDAAGIDRVLHMLAAGEQLTIQGVTITGGNAGNQPGGGIHVAAGRLELKSCVVSDNHTAHSGAGVYDGAWSPSVTITIVNSWITNNTGSGALYTTSGLYLDRSTISANRNSSIGAVSIWDSHSNVYSSTVAGNDSDGIMVGASDVEITGSTIADNTGHELVTVYQHLSGIGISNTMIVGSCFLEDYMLDPSDGGNIESPGNTCNFGSSDLVNVANPMISDLGWYGGPTPVHRPLPGSPAVDQAIAAPNCPILDQRGLVRPLDGGGSSAAVCDIGAVELAGAGEIFVETFESGFFNPWSAAVW
jgi:hypothetical protein